MHVDCVRAAADAAREANENQPERSDLQFADPLDFWIKQVGNFNISLFIVYRILIPSLLGLCY